MVSEPEPDVPEVEYGRVSSLLLEHYEQVFAEHQKLTAKLMRLTDLLHSTATCPDREFVGDEIALVMNCHPETGRAQLAKSVLACSIPGLLASMEAGELTERHVLAASDELHRCLADGGLREQVLASVLSTCRQRAAPGPRPGSCVRSVRRSAGTRSLRAPRQRPLRG